MFDVLWTSFQFWNTNICDCYDTIKRLISVIEWQILSVILMTSYWRRIPCKIVPESMTTLLTSRVHIRLTSLRRLKYSTFFPGTRGGNSFVTCFFRDVILLSVFYPVVICFQSIFVFRPNILTPVAMVRFVAYYFVFRIALVFHLYFWAFLRIRILPMKSFTGNGDFWLFSGLSTFKTTNIFSCFKRHYGDIFHPFRTNPFLCAAKTDKFPPREKFQHYLPLLRLFGGGIDPSGGPILLPLLTKALLPISKWFTDTEGAEAMFPAKLELQAADIIMWACRCLCLNLAYCCFNTLISNVGPVGCNSLLVDSGKFKL